MNDADRIIELLEAQKRKPRKRKSRYMKRVVNLIFFTAFVLTVIYLYFFWRFQQVPDTLILATFGFLGVEAVALAKIKWEEVKAEREEGDHESH